MDLVFTTDKFAREERYAAWQAAICDFYVNVDVSATKPDDYRGFIREARFGDVVLSDILLSEQSIKRNQQHISRLDKDCYYLQLIHSGQLNVIQNGHVHASNAARGAVFYATEQYELQCIGEARSFYLEIPRKALSQRFPKEQIPVSATINTTTGLGRIATEFCSMLASEGSRLTEDTRKLLGSQLMDTLALSLMAPDEDIPASDGSIQLARLRSVQRWIETRLSDPELALEKVAAANGMSLRYLHQIFRHCDMSASEWIWNRRLQRAYDVLSKGDGRSITSIAYDHGFNSSAHFSTLFRRKYGMAPRDLARSSQNPG
ncbi:helix-turn-helix domain-containing protein [Roseibium sp.]|uniref:helix-turn-helix domain-containing protein n=1 Tax=Roseibium sp. TaxID=1936156 RepID=UPI003A97E732